jgi:hypothetical protein
MFFASTGTGETLIRDWGWEVISYWGDAAGTMVSFMCFRRHAGYRLPATGVDGYRCYIRMAVWVWTDERGLGFADENR